jgi:hypothetical protein
MFSAGICGKAAERSGEEFMVGIDCVLIVAVEITGGENWLSER